MATKAELEAELADLRKQLAERPTPAPQAPDEPETQAAGDEAKAAEIDWDKEVGDIMAQLEDIPQKQPLLLALGAFAVGYLIGRSR